MPKINQPASKIRMPFDEWFPVAQKYYQDHKNLLVPLDYEIKEKYGVSIESDNIRKYYL